MPGPILLEVNDVEITGDTGMEWNLVGEEVLGSTGRATLIVQDRTNTWEPQPYWPVVCQIRSGPLAGWKLFNGEIIKTPLELRLHKDWRSWKLECADMNNEVPQRLVGAADGRYWEDVDGHGDYINIDPDAHSLATDKLTVQNLFDKYMRINGVAINTTDFVGEYIPDLATIQWETTTLQRALEDMARQVADNLQFWIDPDLKFHWVIIPAWQDLLQHTVEVYGHGFTGGDEAESLSGAGFPEFAPESANELPAAPYFISDERSEDPNQIGADNIKATFDGSTMPEQIYVRGATGYVYNAPAVNPAGETIVVNPEGYGSKATEKFRLTFNASTKIWQRLSSGLISSTFITVGAGGPFDVKFVRVPYNPSNGKGGHFWELLTGPNVGKLVDNDTNYFGYGDITVEKIVVTYTEPKIGIGGTGWVNEVIQDKNKRQAYLEAEISETQALRDRVGGQALYRASFPTLRGSMTVNGKPDPDDPTGRVSADGWRVGQVVPIVDARFPESLADKLFMIQRVGFSLLEGTDIREYDIDWGDGPESRWSMEAPPTDDLVLWPNPATEVVIEAFDLSPGPNSSQTLVGQLMSKDGQPWKIAGRVVSWSLLVKNAAGTTITGQGTLTPEVSATDRNGKARTILRTGSATGLVYYVFAAVAAV